MPIDISTFEEMERRISSAGPDELLEIKIELGRRLSDIGRVRKENEDATWRWYLYLESLCDIRLGACRWNSVPVGDIRIVSLTAAELDFFAEWYDLASAVARSINQRQKDGRGGCGTEKGRRLSAFVKKYVDEIEKLIARSNRYAEYMQERSAKLLRMIKTGRFSEVGHIDSLNSLYI